MRLAEKRQSARRRCIWCTSVSDPYRSGADKGEVQPAVRAITKRPRTDRLLTVSPCRTIGSGKTGLGLNLSDTGSD